MYPVMQINLDPSGLFKAFDRPIIHIQLYYRRANTHTAHTFIDLGWYGEEKLDLLVLNTKLLFLWNWKIASKGNTSGEVIVYKLHMLQQSQSYYMPFLHGGLVGVHPRWRTRKIGKVHLQHETHGIPLGRWQRRGAYGGGALPFDHWSIISYAITDTPSNWPHDHMTLCYHPGMILTIYRELCIRGTEQSLCRTFVRY